MTIYKPQPPDHIERVEIELTSTCNLSCPLCKRVTHGAPDPGLYRPLHEITRQLLKFLCMSTVTQKQMPTTEN
jgi:MoaA/NifB/PqqE/SkfB family radical SAM enzyme